MNIDQMIDRKADMYSAMQPQQIQQQAKISGGLLDALAAQKALSDKQAAKNQLAMAMQEDAKTVTQQNEEALTQRSQMEMAQGLGGILKNRQNRQNQNAKLIRNMNPAMLKAMGRQPMGRRPVQRAAQGGIVGFSGGQEVFSSSTNEDTTIPDGLRAIYNYIMSLTKRDKKNTPYSPVPAFMDQDFLDFNKNVLNKIPTLEGDVEKVVPRLDNSVLDMPAPPDVAPPVEAPVEVATGIGGGVTVPDSGSASAKERLIAFLTGRNTGRGLVGGGSRTRQLADFDRGRRLENLAQFKAQTDRETAEASKELNRIRNDQLNFSALQTRYAALLKLYDEISAEEREKYQTRITTLKNDPNKRNKESNDKELQAIELEIASNIAKRAGQESDMLGDYNIIAEIKALGERLRNYNFDASRGVRKVSD